MKLLKKEDLINLIIKAINFPKKKYKNTSSLNSFEDWDSIGHLNIMLQLDQKLSGKAKNIKELEFNQVLNYFSSKRILQTCQNFTIPLAAFFRKKLPQS